ncbi:MAG: enoyl-CoA hydratase/isomerase family protein [Bacteriovoracaceae bacterium]|nr:enoyl-CoA hydratase/isomerase family protein [Bacteriovoracaceae bacterium]
MLLYQEENFVATITFNRPEIHNAFNEEFIFELTRLFLKINKNKKLRLVVIKALGDSFCAGADLEWMKKMKHYTTRQNLKDAKNLQKMFLSLDACPIPVIALVQGAAMGGGAGILCTCDYVLAKESAYFAFSEVRLGLIPAVISPFVVRKIGASYARATFLSGARFSTIDALHMGLIHETVKSEEALDRLGGLIKEFLKAGPLASREAKKLLTQTLHNKNFWAQTCKDIARLRVSEEAQEGMLSLLQKRKATWQL